MNPERQPRRPMTAALLTSETLPPEAIELIRAGTPRPRVATTVLETPAAAPAPATPPEQAEAAPSSEENAVAPEVVPPPQETERGAAGNPAPVEAGEAKPARSKPVRDREPEPMALNALVSMTFRVPTEIPSSLVRASADRKARRVRPYTQQEIVAEALAQWLKRNGY